MIIYSAEKRAAMDADLRRAQDEFDAAVIAGIQRSGGVSRWLDSGCLCVIERDVLALFHLYRDDLGLAFAAVVEYADHWGFSVEVLDEDARQWRADTNLLAMAAVT